MTRKEEDQIIRDRYAMGGYHACMPELQHLRSTVVRSRANRMGIELTREAFKRLQAERAAGRRKPEKKHWMRGFECQDIDAMAFVKWQNEMLKAWR